METPVTEETWVQLETREGEFVTEVAVPPFELMPEILTWGGRSFIRSADRPLVYREGFNYNLPAVRVRMT